MELLAIIGAVVVFLIAALGAGWYFGVVSFTFSDEITGKEVEFKRKEK